MTLKNIIMFSIENFEADQINVVLIKKKLRSKVVNKSGH